MRRFARHLFTLCSALSLLLCVAACAAWVRSHFGGDAWFRLERPADGADRLRVHVVGWSGGLFFAGRAMLRTPAPGEVELPLTAYVVGEPGDMWADEPIGFWGRLGFGRGSDRRFWGVTYTFPAWSVVAVSGVLPAVVVRRRLRSRAARGRAAAGLCPSCGYDVRASAGRCSECGAETMRAP